LTCTINRYIVLKIAEVIATPKETITGIVGAGMLRRRLLFRTGQEIFKIFRSVDPDLDTIANEPIFDLTASDQLKYEDVHLIVFYLLTKPLLAEILKTLISFNGVRVTAQNVFERMDNLRAPGTNPRGANISSVTHALTDFSDLGLVNHSRKKPYGYQIKDGVTIAVETIEKLPTLAKIRDTRRWP
jgi:hypothetical protein